MVVSKPVNFNGKMYSTVGKVVGKLDDSYLVDFKFNDVEYRGWWLIEHCKVLSL